MHIYNMHCWTFRLKKSGPSRVYCQLLIYFTYRCKYMQQTYIFIWDRHKCPYMKLFQFVLCFIYILYAACQDPKEWTRSVTAARQPISMTATQHQMCNVCNTMHTHTHTCWQCPCLCSFLSLWLRDASCGIETTIHHLRFSSHWRDVGSMSACGQESDRKAMNPHPVCSKMWVSVWLQMVMLLVSSLGG